jgi:RhtB (resistance to homoserine/threonine) family protein
MLAILPVHLAVMVSPGPNMVFVTTTALQSGRAHGLSAGLGVAVGTLIWMTAAAVGVAVILKTFPVIGLGLKIAGGLYLIWLGYRLWTSRGAVDMRAGRVRQRKWSSFRRGAIVNLTSPKSAAYFGSIFAAFLTGDVAPQALAILILVLFLVSVSYHAILAVTFSAEAVRGPYLRYAMVINRIAGTLLVFFGLRLAASALAE